MDDREQDRHVEETQLCCSGPVAPVLFALFASLFSQIFYAGILAAHYSKLGVRSDEIGLHMDIRPFAMVFASLLCLLLLRCVRPIPLIFLALTV